MKKPEIEDVYLDGPTTCVAINGKTINSKEVSEMIDALIEAYHLVQSLKKTPEWNVNVHPIDEENIINALKKAGCSD